MDVASKGQEFVGRLYELIRAYEADPASLDDEEFRSLYRGAVRAIERSGEASADAFGLDQALFNAVSLEEIDASDLRNVVSHALTIHHRYHADYGRGFEQAYRWCEQARVQQIPDLKYIHTYLLPLLFKPGAVGGNLDVCLYLLEQLGRFENMANSPVWEDDQAATLLNEEAGAVAYQLARRRVKYSADKLTKVPGTLEQNLQKDHAFKRLRQEHAESTPLLAHLIVSFGYEDQDSWWKRLGRGIAGAFRGLVERTAGEYMAYELTKRKGAYIVQILLILLILAGGFVALFGWGYKSNQRYDTIVRYLEAEGKTWTRLEKDRKTVTESERRVWEESRDTNIRASRGEG